VITPPNVTPDRLAREELIRAIGDATARGVRLHASRPDLDDTMRLILRLLINAFALWCAATFINGIHYAGSWQGLLGLALVFGFVNTFIRPVLRLLSLPITILTLGLFTLVINACMLLLTAWLAVRFDIAFTVRGFHSALLGALLISVISMVLGFLFKKEERKDE
jgi:putative membrane protein